jgi:hypothetical protein
MMNLEGCGRKLSWYNFNAHLSGGTEEIQENTQLRVEIWNRDLPNAKNER